MKTCALAYILDGGGRDGVGGEDATTHHRSTVQRLDDVLELLFLVLALDLPHGDNDSLLVLRMTPHPQHHLF